MSRCASCGANIVWIRMRPSGKRHPVNADTIERRIVMSGNPRAGDVEGAVRWTGVSHFATCPNANSHRR